MTAQYTVDRVWYGFHGPQWAWRYTSATAGTLPCIVYIPGGGWKGAQREAFEIEPMWAHGLNRTGGTYVGDYHVFVLNGHGVGYTTQLATFNSEYSGSADYAVGDVVWHDGGGTQARYQCRQVNGASTSVIEPNVTANWENYWWVMGKGTRAWVDGETYAAADYVRHDSTFWRCTRAHTASAANDEPDAGTNQALYWREVGPNEAAYQQLTDTVETTPGFGESGVVDVHQFLGWLKRNASTYSINPDKIILAGASAGGQRAGLAAFSYDQPRAHNGIPAGMYRWAPFDKTRPAAVYLGITPVDFRQYTTGTLLNGLWGRDFTDAEYVAIPQAEKDAASVKRALLRSGLSLPTYLNYFLSRHDDGNAATVYSTGNYHHALNGWAMLQALTDTRANGGLAETGHRFLETSATASSVDTYTIYNGTKTTTSYAASSSGRVIADDFFGWAATTLSL